MFEFNILIIFVIIDLLFCMVVFVCGFIVFLWFVIIFFVIVVIIFFICCLGFGGDDDVFVFRNIRLNLGFELVIVEDDFFVIVKLFLVMIVGLLVVGIVLFKIMLLEDEFFVMLLVFRVNDVLIVLKLFLLFEDVDDVVLLYVFMVLVVDNLGLIG